MRTIQEIDQHLAELEAKRRPLVTQADALDARATTEILKKGKSLSAGKASRLRAQIPAIDRAIAVLQNERVAAVEQERVEREAARWGTIRADVAKIVDRVENAEGLLLMAIVELHAAQHEGDELLAAGVPRLPPGFDAGMLGNLISLARVRIRELTTIPAPLALSSPLATAIEFGKMVLQLAPPEESASAPDNSKSETAPPAQPAAGR